MARQAWIAAACLVFPAAASAQVVGGTDAPAGKWPDAAAVYFGNQAGCSGTLVAPNVVLTAGHCIGGVRSVMVGSNDLRSGGERIEVVDETAYPESYRTYDVGVLVLASDASVEPRVIAHGCARDQFIADGAQVAIVGFGATTPDASGFTPLLQEATATISDADCSDTDGCNGAVSPGGELVAGGDGVDSCNGDSGGPLYLLTPRGDFLVGVTSRGLPIGDQPCGQGGIYVRADAVVEWIEQTAGVDLPEPVCNFPPAPTAVAIEVVAGETADTVVEPNDADPGDSHTFAIATPPAHGDAEVAADGTVTYTADGDYDGPDAIVVAVTDDGAPPETAEVSIPVTVLPAPAGCGCRGGGGSPPAAAAIAVAVAVIAASRRRRGGAGRRASRS